MQRSMGGIHNYPPAPSPKLVPFQRPPEPQSFTGRETELTQVLEKLQPGRTVLFGGLVALEKAFWRQKLSGN